MHIGISSGGLVAGSPGSLNQFLIFFNTILKAKKIANTIATKSSEAE